MEDFKYPLRALPWGEQLHWVDIMKRAIIASARMVVKVPITPKRLMKAGTEWMGEIYRAAFREGQEGRRPEMYYSESSREVLRALRVVNPYEDDAWCLYLTEIWETDMAYRNRGQDIFPLMNREEMKNHPRREMMRLFDITCSREAKGGQLPKMAVFGKILRVALLSRTVRRMAQSFFLALNMSHIEASIEDRYWNANKFDYNYEGKTYEERMAWRREEDKNWNKPIKMPEKARISLNAPNKAFYELNPEEAEKVAEETKEALIAHHAQYVATHR